MLRSLRIINFKAVADVTVQFSPVTLLIGANGSGKTTILQAIDLLGWLVTDSLGAFLTQHEWEYADLPHLHAKGAPIIVEADIDLDGRSLRWGIFLIGGRGPSVAAEHVIDRASGKTLLQRSGRELARMDEESGEIEALPRLSLPSSFLSTLDDKEDERRFPSLVALRKWALAIRGYFFLDPLKLRSANRGKTQEIGTHGELLAPFLASLKKKNPDGFMRIVERVQQHYPRLVGLTTRRTGYGWTYLEVTERWNGEEARFNARQVSDGLLRLIAVAAMQELGTRASVFLLDEIENGLHPHLMSGLLSMLREHVEHARGAAQVVATTHSPIAVNYCQPAEVVLVSRAAKGKVEVKRLDEARQVATLLRSFDLGELWYNVGEEKLRE